MAEPKSSTGNTAMRSTPTGADTALARASGSEPMICFNCSTFPLANASLTRCDNADILSADPRSSSDMARMALCASARSDDTEDAAPFRSSPTPESWDARAESDWAACATELAKLSRPGFRLFS